MQRAGVLLLGLLVGACGGEPPPPSGAISSEQAQKLILERDEARDVAAAREHELQREIEGLRAEIADLRAQLGLAEESAEEAADRAARYEEGLGKAVQELNQVSQSAAAAKSIRPSVAAPRAARAPRPEISYYSDPRVSVVDRSVAAAGRLYNSGDAEAIGTLYVELLRNGEVIDTRDQPFRVGANSWASWQEEFQITPSGATVSVRARMEF